MQTLFIHEVSSCEAFDAAEACRATTILLPAVAALGEFRRRARGLGAEIFVAVSAADSATLDAELDALGSDLPDGVALADCRGRIDLQHLSIKLAVREALANRPEGSVRVLAMAGQSAAGVLALPAFAGGLGRLAGLAWDPGVLGQAIGIDLAAPTLKIAASQVVFAAAAARVPAFFALSPQLDAATLTRRCAQVHRAGYGGVILKTPAQFAIVRRDLGMIDKRP